MMTTSTLTLAEFLLARFAEDARAAREALANRSPKSWAMVVTQALVTPDGTVEVSPDRVLIECEAKRRIVELAQAAQPGYGAIMNEVLWCLSVPYADHPFYRPEWRP